MRSIIFILITMLSMVVFAKEKVQITRLSVSTGNLNLNNEGDIVGETKGISAYTISLEFLKTNYSSSYDITVTPMGSVKLHSLEKGYFYYPNGTEGFLARQFDWRVGGTIGAGRFEMHDVNLNGIIYHDVSTYALTASLKGDLAFRIKKSTQLGLGAQYVHLKGYQDIFWSAQGLQTYLSLNWSY